MAGIKEPQDRAEQGEGRGGGISGPGNIHSVLTQTLHSALGRPYFWIKITVVQKERSHQFKNHPQTHESKHLKHCASMHRPRFLGSTVICWTQKRQERK